MNKIIEVEYYRPEAHYGDVTCEECVTWAKAEARARYLSRKYGEAFAVERELDRGGRFVRDVRATRFVEGYLDFRDKG